MLLFKPLFYFLTPADLNPIFLGFSTLYPAAPTLGILDWFVATGG